MDGAAEVRLNINKLHYPVTVLGPGERVGIWLQGCSIGCHGCISLDTWPADDRHAASVAAVLAWLDGISGMVDGVTISGGEPFDQPGALLGLLRGIRGRRELAHADVLVYSGRTLELLTERFPDHLALIDALISDPFLGHHDGATLRGSSNQRLTLLSDLGRRRYEGADHDKNASTLQVEVNGGRIWMIGIPQRGDIERFEATMRSKGVALEDVSWQP